MKVVLFCGGFGTRLREYSETIPKPLVNIGDRPIIWNLMKYYAHHGHKDFVLCLGYRGDLIKEFFLDYRECMSTDFVLSNGAKDIQLLGADTSDWRITFRNTGLRSNIGQRLLAVREDVEHDEIFLANYSDGLSDLPLEDFIRRFERSNAVAAFVCVRPSNSLSKVTLADGGIVTSIDYVSNSIYINGGFFALRREIFDYIEPGEELVEEPFRRLIEERRLLAYTYDGFWCAMDTFKDKKKFDDFYEQGNRPWEVWERGGSEPR
jgi:glucose-1-phosphate cytidylyltransferase